MDDELDDLDDLDALEDDDGDVFDEAADVFEKGIDDADEGEEGVFRDAPSTFSSPKTPPVAHANPLTNAAQEAAQYMTPKPTALELAKSGKGQLVAKWMSKRPGDFRVAWSMDGKLVEAWRHPTREEFEAFKERGKWLKGGVRQVGEAPASADAVVEQTFWQKHKKKVGWGAVLLALAGGSYWAYKKYWAEADGTVEDTK